MQDIIEQLLTESRRIAIVGLSDNPWRISYQIAESLQYHGYDIYPVNPLIERWKDLPAFPDLHAVPSPIDIVNVFRRTEHLAGIVEDAIAVRARAIWTQIGVVDHAAATRAEEAGLLVVMNRCIAVERARVPQSA